MQGESIGRILYTHLRGLAIIPLGKSLLKCSSHLPAYSGEPPNVFGVAPDRGCRVSPCNVQDASALCTTGTPWQSTPFGTPPLQTRLCGPSPQGQEDLHPPTLGRSLTVIPLYGVRTFLDAIRHRDYPTRLAPALYDPLLRAFIHRPNASTKR